MTLWTICRMLHMGLKQKKCKETPKYQSMLHINRVLRVPRYYCALNQNENLCFCCFSLCFCPRSQSPRKKSLDFFLLLIIK